MDSFCLKEIESANITQTTFRFLYLSGNGVTNKEGVTWTQLLFPWDDQGLPHELLVRSAVSRKGMI